MAEAFCDLASSGHINTCPLTDKELRFLHRLLLADDLEKALAHAPVAGPIESFQASICAKLGVRSVLQAISVSSANRWFDELPYDVQDVSGVVEKQPTPEKLDRETRCA